MTDIFYEGWHLKDYKTVYDLIDVDEERVTLVFEGQNKMINSTMMLSGAKAFLPMRHMAKIAFETDCIFDFQVCYAVVWVASARWCTVHFKMTTDTIVTSYR